MSKKTSILELPYPEDTDVPNGPAQVKALADRLEEILSGDIGAVPQCLVRKTTKTSIPSAEEKYLTFATEVEDTDTMHSTSENTGRITCVTPGLYLCHFTLQWFEALNNANAAFRAWFRKTIKAGGTLQAGATKSAGIATPAQPLAQTVAKPIRMVAGDYIEVGVFSFEAKELYGEDATFGHGQEFGAVKISD